MDSETLGEMLACSKDVQEEPVKHNGKVFFWPMLDAVVCMGTLAWVTRQYSDKYTQTTDIYIITYTASTPTYIQYLSHENISY